MRALSDRPAGGVTIGYRFTPDGTKLGSGTLILLVNGEPCGEGKLERTLFRHGLEPFEVGRDSITPVAPDYKDAGAFEFTGQISEVRFELG